MPDFVINQFNALKKQADSKVWCFPDTTKQIHDRKMAGQERKPIRNRTKNADTFLLTGGVWVPRDLRRTGATLMRSIKVAPAIIERVLNHVEPSKLIRTHQNYGYAEEERDAWNRIGRKLTESSRQTM